MKQLNKEIAVGAFMIVGLMCLTYLALGLAKLSFGDDGSYIVRARFVSVSGLSEGAGVEIAGVVVGRVDKIHYDVDATLAVVDLRIPGDISIQEDAIASIRTTGITGPKFVKISPGGSDVLLSAGDELFETESSISLEELVSKYIFEGTN